MRGRFATVLAVISLITASCGARLTHQQLTTARAAADRGASSAVTTSGGDGGDTAASPADQPGPTVPGSPAAATSGGASTPTTGGGVAAAGTATTVSVSTTAPPGGNGGATDVGVTADTITLGNVTTLSGPVPGLFQGAITGTQAFIAYQNSIGGLFGRKLKLDARDDQFDSGQNRTQTLDLLNKAFAFAGSTSLYDDAAAEQEGKSGIPDAGVGLANGRRQLPNFFSPAPQPYRGYRTGQFLWYNQHYPDAVKAVGTLYGDVPASKLVQEDLKAAAQSVGWNFVYERGFQATETDFTADVVQMRQRGVKLVYLVTADAKTMARVAKAMAQQGFNAVIGTGPAGYDRMTVPLGQSAVEGMIIDQQLAMYSGEDAKAIPEVALFNQWVDKVKPGSKPDLYAAWSWASTRLLVQAMQSVGPHLTRAAVVDALKKVSSYDDNGMFAKSGPGTSQPQVCYVMLQIKGGNFVRLDPATGYRCDGTFFKTG
jgi:ABC-type branched-subunit amino acid transport system substrate-binding protein